MPRELESLLSEKIRESEFSFIPKGTYKIAEIYALVKKNFPQLCDDAFLCTHRKNSILSSPEWHHVVRNCMKQFKKEQKIKFIERGIWEIL